MYKWKAVKINKPVSRKSCFFFFRNHRRELALVGCRRGSRFEHILVLATSMAYGHCANTARASQKLFSVQS